MKSIIAYCGLVCSECPAFIAKKDDDNELRKKTAEDWSKQFGQEITPESINCDGCFSSDVVISYCHICEIRKCGLKKKVKNCAYCDEYICEKLEKWFKNVPDAKKRLDEIRSTR